MDFDDIDEAGEAPPKPSRFAPKSKFQPKSKPKPGPAAAAQPKPEPSSDGGVVFPVSVKKEQDSGQSTNSAMEDDCKPSLPSHGLNGTKPEPEPIVDAREPMDVDLNSVSFEAEQEVEPEEDYVVSEYDVCFNPTPLDDGTQFFVFQYPLRPSYRPYDLDERCTEVRMKANTDLEIDMTPDVGSSEYDPDSNAARIWTKEVLSSKWKPQQKTSYAIGVVVGNKLHINPLYAVRQLRPSLDLLNPSEPVKKEVTEFATKAASSTTKASGKLVKVVEQKEEEPWIPLKYHGSSSDLSARYLEKMTPGVSSSLTFPMKSIDYLDSMCPRAAVNKAKPVWPSKSSLLSKPLDERIRSLLAKGPHIYRFSALRHYAPDDPEEDLLRVLEQYALLVQGHWVAKTPVRFPDEKPPFLLARDYILLLFSRSATVKKSELEDPKLRPLRNVWKDVLRDLAFERQKFKDWKFKVPADVKFMKDYPDIVKEQERKWEANEVKMIEKIGLKKNPTKPVTPIRPQSSVPLDRSASKSASRERTMSNETREALPKVLRELFQTHKVCSLQTICKCLRDMAVNKKYHPKADARAALAAALGVDAPQEELLEVITEVATHIHGVFVLKSSLEHPEHNPLRKVVIDLLIGKGPNAKLKKSEILEASKIQLQREPSSEELRKVLSELCVSNSSAWVLKSGDGSL